MNVKQSVKNNCFGCPRQPKCEYGNVTYDNIERRTMCLWEKYVHLFPFDIGKSIQEYSNRFSKQRKFTTDDVYWLNEYLEDEKQRYEKTCTYGKCGVAYARYDKWKNGIQNIENALKKAKEAAQ